MKTFRKYFAILWMGYFVLAACGRCHAEAFRITGAWVNSEADEQAMSETARDSFPSGTSKVFCLIQWVNATEPVDIAVRWYYETAGVHILDSIFVPPVPDGRGSVSLGMSPGKVLPSGAYRCEIMVNNELVRELRFLVFYGSSRFCSPENFGRSIVGLHPAVLLSASWEIWDRHLSRL